MRWLLPLLLLGCGDDGTSPSDAGTSDSRTDSSTEDGPTTGCDYTEESDATNDTTGNGTAEVTQLTVNPLLTTLCGSFASDHHDDITVDVDAFRVTVATEMDLVVRLEANAGSLELSGVDVYSGPTFGTLVGSATWYGDHGVTSVRLVPGTYEILPYALNSTPAASTIEYRVKLSEDTPTRCMPITTGGIVESHDGTDSTGNDIYSIPSGSPIAFTANNADTPEAGGTITPGTNVRFSGSLADVMASDQYEDRDTFLFDVPNGANELSVRLDWQGTGDLDIMLFEGAVLPPEKRAIKTATTGPETLFYSIKAGVTYSIDDGCDASDRIQRDAV
ncbi:MAG: hypothetical protein ACKV2T_39740 [Kofleriaceae bacterium]